MSLGSLKLQKTQHSVDDHSGESSLLTYSVKSIQGYQKLRLLKVINGLDQAVLQALTLLLFRVLMLIFSDREMSEKRKNKKVTPKLSASLTMKESKVPNRTRSPASQRSAAAASPAAVARSSFRPTLL